MHIMGNALSMVKHLVIRTGRLPLATHNGELRDSCHKHPTGSGLVPWHFQDLVGTEPIRRLRRVSGQEMLNASISLGDPYMSESSGLRSWSHFPKPKGAKVQQPQSAQVSRP